MPLGCLFKYLCAVVTHSEKIHSEAVEPEAELQTDLDKIVVELKPEVTAKSQPTLTVKQEVEAIP